MTTEKRRYYGKYRGRVIPPQDLQMTGRITALITVGGTPLTVVAEACTPYAGPGCGLYAIPALGAGVWIEFEEGNLDKPIWVGCWWSEADLKLMLLPDTAPPTPDTVVLRTKLARLKMNNLTGETTLELLPSPLSARVHMLPGLLEITLGPNSIKMTPAGISLNGTALVVLPGG